jgi:hypothetical protein
MDAGGLAKCVPKNRETRRRRAGIEMDDTVCVRCGFDETSGKGRKLCRALMAEYQEQ